MILPTLEMARPVEIDHEIAGEVDSLWSPPTPGIVSEKE
jgi:hypothetical protein